MNRSTASVTAAECSTKQHRLPSTASNRPRGRSAASSSPVPPGRRRRDTIAFWRENEEDRRLIKHALELYSDVEAAREQMIDVADRATS